MNLNNRCKFQVEHVGRKDPKRRELEGFWPNVAVALCDKKPDSWLFGPLFFVTFFFGKKESKKQRKIKLYSGPYANY
jgi:hypothetical protein